MRPSEPLGKALAVALCAVLLPWQEPASAWALDQQAPSPTEAVAKAASLDAALKALLAQLSDVKLAETEAVSLPKRFGDLVKELDAAHQDLSGRKAAAADPAQVQDLELGLAALAKTRKLAAALADAAAGKPEEASGRFSAPTLQAVVIVNTPRLEKFAAEPGSLTLDQWSELSSAAAAMSDPVGGVAAAEKILKDNAAKPAPRWGLESDGQQAFAKAYEDVRARAQALVDRYKAANPTEAVARHTKATEQADAMLAGVQIPKSADAKKVNEARARMASYMVSGNPKDLKDAQEILEGLYDASDHNGRRQALEATSQYLSKQGVTVGAAGTGDGRQAQTVAFTAVPKKASDLQTTVPELSVAAQREGKTLDAIKSEWGPKLEKWLADGGAMAGAAWDAFAGDMMSSFKDREGWRAVLCATTIGCNGAAERLTEMSSGFMERAERSRLLAALDDVDSKLSSGFVKVHKAKDYGELPTDAEAAELAPLIAGLKDLWYAKKLLSAKEVESADASLRDRLKTILQNAPAQAADLVKSLEARRAHSKPAAEALLKALTEFSEAAVELVSGQKPDGKASRQKWGDKIDALVGIGSPSTLRRVPLMEQQRGGRLLVAKTGGLPARGGLWTWIEAYEKHNNLREATDFGPFILAADMADVLKAQKRADVLARLLVAVEHHRKNGTLDLAKWGELRQQILGGFAGGGGETSADLGTYGQAFLKQYEADKEQETLRVDVTKRLPKLTGDFDADSLALDRLFEGSEGNPPLTAAQVAVLPAAYKQYYDQWAAGKTIEGRPMPTPDAEAPTKREAYDAMLLDSRAEDLGPGASAAKLYHHYYSVNQAAYAYACPPAEPYAERAAELAVTTKQLKDFCKAFEKDKEYDPKHLGKQQRITNLAYPLLRKLKPIQLQERADDARQALFETLGKLPPDARAALAEEGVDVQAILDSEKALEVNEWTIRASNLVFNIGDRENGDQAGWRTLRDDYLKRTYGEKFMEATDAAPNALKKAVADGDEAAMIKALDGFENPDVITSGYAKKIGAIWRAGPRDRAAYSARDQQIAGMWESHKAELSQAAAEFERDAAAAQNEDERLEHLSNAKLIRDALADPSDTARLLEAFRVVGFPVFDARTVRVGMNTGRLKIPAASEEEKRDIWAGIILAKLAGVELQSQADLKTEANASKIRDWLLSQLSGPVAQGQADFRRDQLVLSRNDELNDRLRGAASKVPGLRDRVTSARSYKQLERFAQSVDTYETARVSLMRQQYDWGRTVEGRSLMALPMKFNALKSEASSALWAKGMGDFCVSGFLVGERTTVCRRNSYAITNSETSQAELLDETGRASLNQGTALAKDSDLHRGLEKTKTMAGVVYVGAEAENPNDPKNKGRVDRFVSLDRKYVEVKRPVWQKFPDNEYGTWMKVRQGTNSVLGPDGRYTSFKVTLLEDRDGNLFTVKAVDGVTRERSVEPTEADWERYRQDYAKYEAALAIFESRAKNDHGNTRVGVQDGNRCMNCHTGSETPSPFVSAGMNLQGAGGGETEMVFVNGQWKNRRVAPTFNQAMGVRPPKPPEKPKPRTEIYVEQSGNPSLVIANEYKLTAQYQMTTTVTRTLDSGLKLRTTATLLGTPDKPGRVIAYDNRYEALDDDTLRRLPKDVQEQYRAKQKDFLSYDLDNNMVSTRIGSYGYSLALHDGKAGANPAGVMGSPDFGLGGVQNSPVDKYPPAANTRLADSRQISYYTYETKTGADGKPTEERKWQRTRWLEFGDDGTVTAKVKEPDYDNADVVVTKDLKLSSRYRNPNSLDTLKVAEGGSLDVVFDGAESLSGLTLVLPPPQEEGALVPIVPSRLNFDMAGGGSILLGEAKPGDLRYMTLQERDAAFFGDKPEGYGHNSNFTFNDEPLDESGTPRVSFDVNIDRSGLTETQLKARYTRAAETIADWTSRDSTEVTSLSLGGLPVQFDAEAMAAETLKPGSSALVPLVGGIPPQPKKPLRYVDEKYRQDFVDQASDYMTQLALWDGGKKGDPLSVVGVSYSFGQGGTLRTSYSVYDYKEQRVVSRKPSNPKLGMVVFRPLPEGAPEDAPGSGEPRGTEIRAAQRSYAVALASGRKAAFVNMVKTGVKDRNDKDIWEIEGFAGRDDLGNFGWHDVTLGKRDDDGHWYSAGDKWVEINVDGRPLRGGGKANSIKTGTTTSMWNFPEKLADYAGNYIQWQVCDDPYSTRCAIAVGVVKAAVMFVTDPMTYVGPAAFKAVGALRKLKLTSDVARITIKGLEITAKGADLYFKYEATKGAIQGTAMLISAIGDNDEVSRFNKISNGVNMVASTAGQAGIVALNARIRAKWPKNTAEPNTRMSDIENIPDSTPVADRTGTAGDFTPSPDVTPNRTAPDLTPNRSPDVTPRPTGERPVVVDNTPNRRVDVEGTGSGRRQPVAAFNEPVRSPGNADALGRRGGATTQLSLTTPRALTGGAGQGGALTARGTGNRNFTNPGGPVQQRGFVRANERAGTGAGDASKPVAGADRPLNERSVKERANTAERNPEGMKADFEAKRADAQRAQDNFRERDAAARSADADFARKQNEARRADTELTRAKELHERRPTERTSERLKDAETRRENASRELAESRGKAEAAKAERAVAKDESVRKTEAAKEARARHEESLREQAAKPKADEQAAKAKPDEAAKAKAGDEKAKPKADEQAAPKEKSRSERKHDEALAKDKAKAKLEQAKDDRGQAKRDEARAVESERRARAEKAAAEQSQRQAKAEHADAERRASESERRAQDVAKEKGADHPDAVEARRDAELARDEANTARLRVDQAQARLADADLGVRTAADQVKAAGDQRVQAEKAVETAGADAGVGVWGRFKDTVRRGVENADNALASRQRNALDPTKVSRLDAANAAMARAYQRIPAPLRRGLGYVRGFGVGVERFGSWMDRTTAKLSRSKFVDPVSGMPADRVKVKVRNAQGKLETKYLTNPDGSFVLQPRPPGFVSDLFITAGHLLQGRIFEHPGAPLGDYESAVWPKVHERPSFKKAVTMEARSKGEVTARVDLATGKIEYGASGPTPKGHVDVALKIADRKGVVEIVGKETRTVGPDNAGVRDYEAASLANDHVMRALKGTFDLPLLSKSLRDSMKGSDVQDALLANRDPFTGESFARLHYDPATRTLKTKPAKGSTEVLVEVAAINGDGGAFRVKALGGAGLDLKVRVNLAEALSRPLALKGSLLEPHAAGSKGAEAVLADAAARRSELAAARKDEFSRELSSLRAQQRAKRAAGQDDSAEVQAIRDLIALERGRREGGTTRSGADGRNYGMLRRKVAAGGVHERLFGPEVVKQTREESCTLASMAHMVNEARARSGVEGAKLTDVDVMKAVAELGYGARMEAEFARDGGLTRRTMNELLPKLAELYGFSPAKAPIGTIFSDALPRGESVGVIVNEQGVGPHMVVLKAHVGADGRPTGLIVMADPALVGPDGRARAVLRSQEQIAALLTGRDALILSPKGEPFKTRETPKAPLPVPAGPELLRPVPVPGRAENGPSTSPSDTRTATVDAPVRGVTARVRDAYASFKDWVRAKTGGKPAEASVDGGWVAASAGGLKSVPEGSVRDLLSAAAKAEAALGAKTGEIVVFGGGVRELHDPAGGKTRLSGGDVDLLVRWPEGVPVPTPGMDGSARIKAWEAALERAQKSLAALGTELGVADPSHVFQNKAFTKDNVLLDFLGFVGPDGAIIPKPGFTGPFEGARESVNVMMMRSDGRLLDPLGGLKDLREGLYRLEPQKDMYTDLDPGQVLRAVRFKHEKGVRFDPRTSDAVDGFFLRPDAFAKSKAFHDDWLPRAEKWQEFRRAKAEGRLDDALAAGEAYLGMINVMGKPAIQLIDAAYMHEYKEGKAAGDKKKMIAGVESAVDMWDVYPEGLSAKVHLLEGKYNDMQTDPFGFGAYTRDILQKAQDPVAAARDLERIGFKRMLDASGIDLFALARTQAELKTFARAKEPQVLAKGQPEPFSLKKGALLFELGKPGQGAGLIVSKAGEGVRVRTTEGTEVVLKRGESIKVGAAANAGQLRVGENSTVSRQHLEIKVGRDGGIAVIDGSSRGTRLIGRAEGAGASERIGTGSGKGEGDGDAPGKPSRAPDVQTYARAHGVPVPPLAWQRPELPKGAELTLFKAQFVDPLTGFFNARYWEAVKGDLAKQGGAMVAGDGDSFGGIDRTARKIAGLDSPAMKKLLEQVQQPMDRQPTKEEMNAIVAELQSKRDPNSEHNGTKFANEILARGSNNARAAAEAAVGRENVTPFRMGGEEVAYWVKKDAPKAAEAIRQAGAEFRKNTFEVAEVLKGHPELGVRVSPDDFLTLVQHDVVGAARTKAEIAGETFTKDMERAAAENIGTFSLGVAHLNPRDNKHGNAAVEALHNADRAIEHSKRLGKDRVTVVSEDGVQTALDRGPPTGESYAYTRDTPDYAGRREEVRKAAEELKAIDPAAYDQWKHAASIDAKSGVYDNEALSRDLPDLLAQHNFVLVIHIDNFKRVNAFKVPDRKNPGQHLDLGHAAGDAALKAMGDLLIDMGAHKDFYAARTQSKEFVLVGSAETLKRVAAELGPRLETERPIERAVAEIIPKSERYGVDGNKIEFVRKTIEAQARADGKDHRKVGTASMEFLAIVPHGGRRDVIAFQQAVGKAFEKITAREEAGIAELAAGSAMKEKTGAGSGKEPPLVDLDEMVPFNNEGSQGTLVRRPGTDELIKIFDKLPAPARSRESLEALVAENNKLLADGLPVPPMEVVRLPNGEHAIRTRFQEGEHLGEVIDRLWDDPATQPRAFELQTRAFELLNRVDALTGNKADRRQAGADDTSEDFANFLLTPEGRIVNIDPLNLHKILRERGELPAPKPRPAPAPEPAPKPLPVVFDAPKRPVFDPFAATERPGEGTGTGSGDPVARAAEARRVVEERLNDLPDEHVRARAALGLPEVQVAGVLSLDGGSAGPVLEGRLNGQTVAVKGFKEHPSRGKREWPARLDYMRQEIQLAREMSDVLGPLGMAPKVYGEVTIAGAKNPAWAMEKINGRLADELTPREARELITPAALQQAARGIDLLKKAGLGGGDSPQPMILLADQVVNGVPRKRGDVVFVDAGGLSRDPADWMSAQFHVDSLAHERVKADNLFPHQPDRSMLDESPVGGWSDDMRARARDLAKDALETAGVGAGRRERVNVDGDPVAAPFVGRALDFVLGDRGARAYNRGMLPGMTPSGPEIAAKAKALKAAQAEPNADVIGEPAGRLIEVQTTGDCGVHALFNDPAMAPVRAVYDALAREQLRVFGNKVSPYQLFLKFAENTAGRSLTSGTLRLESSAIAAKLGLELQYHPTVAGEGDLRRLLIENGGSMQADLSWNPSFSTKRANHAVVIDGAFREKGWAALPQAISANGWGRTLTEMAAHGPLKTLKRLSQDGVWKYVVVDSNFPHPRLMTYGDLSALGLRTYSLRPEPGLLGERLSPRGVAKAALDAWNRSLSPAELQAGAGQLDAKFSTAGGRHSDVVAIVGHEGPITVTAGGHMLKVHPVGRERYVVETPSGRRLPLGSPQSLIVGNSRAADIKLGGLQAEHLQLGRNNGRVLIQALAPGAEVGTLHFERRATRAKTSLTLDDVLPAERAGTGSGDSWSKAYDAALDAVAAKTGIARDRLSRAVDQFHEAEGYGARDIAVTQAQLERHIEGLSRRLPSPRMEAQAAKAAGRLVPVLAPLPGSIHVAQAKVEGMSAALPALADGKRTWMKLSKYQNVEAGPDAAARLKAEGEATAAARADLFDPAKAAELPLPETFMMPEVVGFGPAPKPLIERVLGPEDAAGGDVHALLLSDLGGRSIDRYFDFRKGYKPKDGAAVMTTKDWAALEAAVRRLHALGWAHGDLNPGNIVVARGRDGVLRLGLIDWQTAKRAGEFASGEFEARKRHDLKELAELKRDLLSDGLMEGTGTGSGARLAELSTLLAESPRAERRQAAEEVAALWRKADPAQAEAIGEMAAALASDHGLPAVKDVFDAVVAPALAPQSPPSGLKTAGAPRWAKGAQAEVAARMPTLKKILEDPARLESFMGALSFLRTTFRFNGAETTPHGPISYGRATGQEFRVGELIVSPVSESFRRFVIRVEDAKGTYAVELKMPGDAPERTHIFDTHFTVAADLAAKFPDAPGTVLPVYYGTYKGSARVFGQTLKYAADDPMGIMVFSYQEGKRLRNAPEFIEAQAAKLGMTPDAFRLKAEAHAAAAAIKAHRLGWSGDRPGGGDMHFENVRVLEDGSAVLVGDYGAYEKAKLSKRARAAETTALISRSGEASRAWREKLEPAVVELLSRGEKDPAKLAKIREEVRVELDLDSSRETTGTGSGIGNTIPEILPVSKVFENDSNVRGMRATYSKAVIAGDFAGAVRQIRNLEGYLKTRGVYAVEGLAGLRSQLEGLAAKKAVEGLSQYKKPAPGLSTAASGPVFSEALGVRLKVSAPDRIVWTVLENGFERQAKDALGSQQVMSATQRMLQRMLDGHPSPGMPIKHIAGPIRYLRDRDSGARVLFAVRPDGSLEVFAIADKSNEPAVLRKIEELYGK